MRKPLLFDLAVIGLLGAGAGASFAEIDQAGWPKMAASVMASKQHAGPSTADDLLTAVVAGGEWVCEKNKDRTWIKAFRLRLTPDRLKVVTPTGPILPVAGNPSIFDAAATDGDSKTYSKFGLWEISKDVLTLKWYATWSKDVTRSRALARAYQGVNRFPGEITIDAGFIDNLERGIDVRAMGNENYLDSSLEIKVERIDRAHFSGRSRRFQAPEFGKMGSSDYEYDLVSGKIKNVRSRYPSNAQMRAEAYQPIRCAMPDPLR